MLSKNPLDLIDKEGKFDKEKTAEALRLGIIAELDAINLYLQLAEKIEDENIRRVFIDIAREEKTHVGEFLTLLKQIDPEQSEELVKGAEEVMELTGIKIIDKENSRNQDVSAEVFTDKEWEVVRSSFYRRLNELRTLRNSLTVVEIPGVEHVSVYDKRRNDIIALKLCELETRFEIPQKMIDLARRNGEIPALDIFLEKAVEISNLENKIILEGCGHSKGLLNTEGITIAKLSSWETPGKAVEDISNAISLMGKNGIAPPYKLFVGPKRYSELLKVHEKIGVIELERIKRLVDDIVVVNTLPEDTVLLVATSPNYVDIVVGKDTTIEYLGPEDGKHIFYIWEKLVARVKEPGSIIVLKGEQEVKSP